MFPKIGGFSPKMDSENNGKPYFLMDDLGVPLLLETPKSKQNSGFSISRLAKLNKFPDSGLTFFFPKPLLSPVYHF